MRLVLRAPRLGLCRNRRWLWTVQGLLAGMLILIAATALGGKLSDFLHVAPESWALLDSSEPNTRIEKAVTSGEAWPRSPLQATLRLFGDDLETQSVVLEELKDHAEGAKSATVVYIRDGFLDDSILGDWHQVVFRCLADGSWRVVEARQAWRCRRPTPSERFGDLNCQ